MAHRDAASGGVSLSGVNEDSSEPWVNKIKQNWLQWLKTKEFNKTNLDRIEKYIRDKLNKKNQTKKVETNPRESKYILRHKKKEPNKF